MKSMQMNMRMDPNELRRFKRVAKRLGLNVSGAIRYLMKLADDSYKAPKPCGKAKPWGADDYR